ncbi:MAG TPA: hypothetical protein VFB21_22110 [Chthonomonadaceae bacterium]|nr:hypothetical protein [Chthonomonadaceae bacterium]
MSQTVTMRLPDETSEWLKASARRAGRSVSELGATLFEEARRMSEFAEIEFRTIEGERLACLKGGLRLWKIIMVAQNYGMDAEKTAAHFDLPVWKIQAALHYYEAFPQEIDAAIAEARSMTFEKLKRKLPQLERHEVAPAEEV